MGSPNNTDAKLSKVETFRSKKGIWRTYDATDGLPGEPYYTTPQLRMD